MTRVVLLGIISAGAIFGILTIRAGDHRYLDRQDYVQDLPSASITHADDQVIEDLGDNRGLNIATNETLKSVPSKILLDMPFASQAPTANWDAIHEETCEEAAVIMAVYGLDGRSLSPDGAEREIQRVVDWEKANFGFFESTDGRQTAQIITDLFNKTAKIKYDFNIRDLKDALVDRQPVIILAAGRQLHNPYYKQPGPVYHALVARGFDGDTIITNDPGTKRGERFSYQSSVILAAAHDWVGDPDRILEGRRVMIAVSSP